MGCYYDVLGYQLVICLFFKFSEIVKLQIIEKQLWFYVIEIYDIVGEGEWEIVYGFEFQVIRSGNKKVQIYESLYLQKESKRF